MVHPIQTIAVTGGKGGVGKSNVSVNLAIALAQLGHRVVVLDADLGLANIDVLLGITAKKNLSHVLEGECHLKDILVDGPGGIKIIPASSGMQQLVQLGTHEHAGLIQAFSTLADQMDILIVDTAAGISSTVVNFVQACQEVVLVMTDEPTSITDAYALIKLLNRDYNLFRFRIIANMMKTAQDGHKLFAKLSNVTDRFLDVAIQYVGSIPQDDTLKKAVQRQKAVLDAYPRAKSSTAFKGLAKKIESWPIPNSPRGHLEFFVEHLLEAGSRVE